MRIFFVVSDYVGCGWYRCHLPGVALSDRGHDVHLDVEIGREWEVPVWDIIVFQRQYHPETLETIEYANSLGKLTVYEIDDDLWHVHPTNPGYAFWKEKETIEGAEECIHACKIVTTTTPALAEYLKRFNKNVFVLPNMLSFGHWLKESCNRERRGEKLVVGWAGSMTHWIDLKILTGTMEQLLDEYPQIEFHLAGGREYPFREHERMKALAPVKVWDYSSLLKGFDIGLAPLIDSHFNRCKSDLKYLEYAMMGVPVVASEVEAYTSIKHGENGFLAKNNKDWLKYLRRLIEDAELRKNMGKKARQFAESRTIEKNIILWEKAYRIGP